MIQKTIFLLLLFCGAIVAQSNLNIIAHFKLGEGGAVTYAAGPQQIKGLSKNSYMLKKIGSPVFYASTPEGKTGGSILFKDNNGYYFSDFILGDDSKNFVLEAWVKSHIPEKKEIDAKHTLGVVSLGDGRNGYSIIQQGDKWLALVGGVGSFSFGTVTYENWIHLALVADGDNCTLWMNGEKRGNFRKVAKINPGFAVGNIGQGNNLFYGEVYEVRYSTFEEGQFDFQTNFLLDYHKLKEKKTERLDAQKKLISAISQPGYEQVVLKKLSPDPVKEDYLITKIERKSKLNIVTEKNNLAAKLILTNGIISRSFYVSENLACFSYKNLMNGAEYLRAVKPEARLKLENQWIEIGGLKGQPEKSYLMEEWLPGMENSDAAFVLKDISTSPPKARYPWNVKYNARITEWPPKGLHLTLHFEAPANFPKFDGINVDVHYEIYDGIPVISKWVSIYNNSENKILLEENECEVLALNQDQLKRIHVESDYSFGLVNADPRGSSLMHYTGAPEIYRAGQSTTKVEVDEEYNTWATHNPAEDGFLGYRHYNLLKSKLPMGPSTEIKPGKTYISFKTFEILFDSDDEERNTLAHRRMYRKLAPQVTETLICGGITSNDKEQLKIFLDQMTELGFERLDVMAWPGISHDNLDSDYVSLWKEVVDYAKKRNIVVGGYELQTASRGRGVEYDCIDPKTGKPGSAFGQSVCIASEWRDVYYSKLWKFFDKTNLKTFNMDGPYHGDACASKVHPYHSGLKDSQWEQWKFQTKVLAELQRRNCYIPIPDWYFLNGQCATGMGYREASANLTPQQQMLLGRQYIYDGTWHKIPTMGWMTQQLVGFYTNDKRVGLEPLKDNLDRYERGLVQYLGSGCQFTVRGNRLYDTPETKAMVKKWIDWFKKYREVLTGDIIHLGRPNGRDLDCMMHINPFGKNKGIVMIFNPTTRKINKKITLPLYYTGLAKTATVSERGENPKHYLLNREYEVDLNVEIEADGFTWLVIQ